MALTAEQEAALDGAWALRYCADRLSDLNGNNDPIVADRVWKMRDNAERLDELAKTDLPSVAGET